MSWIACFFAICLTVSVTGKKTVLKNTSIQSAWWWAMAATVVLCGAVGIRTFQLFSAQVQSLLQYSAAVFSLAPFIDILGARRPAHAAWPWFVVLPMILVLHWPAISQLAAENAATPIQIPTPTIVGFAFVVMMGCGNYFGTANMPSAFLAGLGIVLTAIPVSDLGDFSNSWMFASGTFFMLTAVTLSITGRSVREPTSSELTAHDALWADFCSLYGMVWGKRVMDRVNQFAERESWDVRMSAFGFVKHSASVETNITAVTTEEIGDRPLQILCWVLRRFLDPPFLLRYLPESVIPNED